MTTRIYCVSNGENIERLVRASSRSQALSHVARDVFRTRVATQGDLELHLTAGARVEEAKPQAEEGEQA